jgi:hypothetical protein
LNYSMPQKEALRGSQNAETNLEKKNSRRLFLPRRERSQASAGRVL